MSEQITGTFVKALPLKPTTARWTCRLCGYLNSQFIERVGQRFWCRKCQLGTPSKAEVDLVCCG